MKNKNLLFLIILMFFCLPICQNADAQDYGTVKWDQSLAPKNSDGYKPPISKKEERIRRKARRLSMTHADNQVINLKERGRDLSFKQKLRYPFAKRKLRKLESLKGKSDKLQESSSVPGYMTQSNARNEITIEEKEIIKKVEEQDSVELTRQEERLYKRAQRKKRREDRYQRKFTEKEITAEEQEILDLHKKDPDSLSRAEIKEFRQINKKVKQNKKVKKRIHSYYVDSAYASGAPMPVQQKKFRLPKITIRTAKNRPSSFVKNVTSVERRYSPSPKQKTAMYKARSGANMTFIERYRARRGYAKEWLKEEKLKKIYEKEFRKNQLKSTRKMMRKKQKESEKQHKKRQNYLRKKKFLDFFKKKK
jgi:hypothetical protein